jgi:serine/threonine-protein kinase HipA
MEIVKTLVFVYAHWLEMEEPILLGTLQATQTKGRITFSIELDNNWVKHNPAIFLDPDIQNFAGLQYPLHQEIFGLFQDSMPDTWGRTLMQRRAALEKRLEEKAFRNLNSIDYLLGVFDVTRMGGLRLKTDPRGPFLDDNQNRPTPPWAHIRELQAASKNLEDDSHGIEEKKWLDMLIEPGSSLGGARPKANIQDESGELWIAKFPSKNDTNDKAAWEYLAYLLAKDAGIWMAESKIEQISGSHHTFFTKRFDRKNAQRIHFSSGMTMTGFSEAQKHEKQPSYLHLAEFIQFQGTHVQEDLEQLWRRIVFSIAISNTDDHLRNHGFLLTQSGWRLSPSFDINPSIEKSGLVLAIDEVQNNLDFNLVKSVGKHFHLNDSRMDAIIKEVSGSVSHWRQVANQIGISRKEQESMAGAFRV